MVAVATRNDDKATGIRSGIEEGDKPLYANFTLAVLEPCILVAVIPACPSDAQLSASTRRPPGNAAGRKPGAHQVI